MTMVLETQKLRLLLETAAAAFALLALTGPRLIPVLRTLKFGQEVRKCGPESHQKKQGTPTMGGIMILSSLVLASAVGFAAARKIPESALQILFLTLAFGLIGFADDFLKIRRHDSRGLSAKQKLALQLLAAFLFSLWVWFRPEQETASGLVYLPFTGYGETAVSFRLPVWLFLPFSVFVILGTDNGVNFTDGLDGLCVSVTAAVAAFFAVCGLLLSEGTALVSAAVFGSMLGFLLFNAYPAKVFMGDTGSLALGGFVAASAVLTGSELYLLIVGFVYMAEVLSVMIQVTYFRLTHGKRFFRMAPIHHHFELCGNSETRIVAAFTAVSILLAGLSVCGFLFTR